MKTVYKKLEGEYKKPSEDGFVEYDGEQLKVVEIPYQNSKSGWNQVHKFIEAGYTVKSTLEKRSEPTIIVVLEPSNN